MNHTYFRIINIRIRLSFFISGVGSIGTFLEGPIVGWIVAQYGWPAMFTCMILLSVFGAITSFRAARYQRAIKLVSASSTLEQIVS
jgi:OPA family glycerol-3-phosphate transporter-like MFS transporter 1/2